MPSFFPLFPQYPRITRAGLLAISYSALCSFCKCKPPVLGETGTFLALWENFDDRNPLGLTLERLQRFSKAWSLTRYAYEMQIFRPSSRPTESETLGFWPSNQRFAKLSGWFRCTLKKPGFKDSSRVSYSSLMHSKPKVLLNNQIDPLNLLKWLTW